MTRPLLLAFALLAGTACLPLPARDLVRLVQDARKEAGLHVADRIELTVVLPAAQMGWVQAHEEMVCRETPTVELTTRVGPELAIERLAKVEA